MNALIEQINSTGKTFIDFALPMLMQSSALIIILLALDMLLHKRIRAVFRYWIWMIVLVKLILPPSLSLPTSPTYWFGGKIINSAQNPPIQEEPVTYSFSNLDIALPSNDFTPTMYRPEPVFNSEEPVATPPAIPKTPLSWQAIVFLSWLAVSCMMFILLIQRTFFVKRLINQSQNADEILNNILEQARLQMRLKSKIELRLSDTALSPSVCGLFKPVILIPMKFIKTINPNDFNAILLHELAHIKRNDLWVNMVQAILQIIYIYNPLLWIANIAIRNVREQAVDEMVLVAMGEHAEEYPKTLLNISRLSFGSAALSLRLIGVAESKKALITRIKHITSRPFPKTVKISVTGLITILLAAFVLLPMAKSQRENSNSQTNPPAVTLNSTSEEGLSSIVVSNKPILASPGAPNRKMTPVEYITEFITKNGQLGQVRYGETRELLTKDELPILYELLDDDEYAPYWNQVVILIGQVCDDPNTIDILLKFIQRDDNNKLDRHSFLSKANAFSSIGKIGGDMAESILRKAATKEGARELTKDWIDKPLTEYADRGEMLIRMIQESSLMQLVLKGKPEDLALIEKMYNEQKEISIKNHKMTEILWGLMEVMAEKDRIAAVGLETYQNMSSQRRLGSMDQYDLKYFSDLADAGLLDPGLKEFLKTIPEKESAEAEIPAKFSTQFTAKLPNGVMVELLGVCEHPSEGKQWWRADGSKLEKAPYEKTSRTIVTDEGNKIREIAIGFSGQNLKDANYRIQSNQSQVYTESHINPNDKESLDLMSTTAVFSKNQKNTSILINVSAGPWETKVVSDGKREVNIALFGGEAAYRAASEENGKSIVGVMYRSILGDDGRTLWENRIIAKDIKGNELTGKMVSGAIRGRSGVYRYEFALPLDQIASFEYQTRPFYQIDFDNVALEPDENTDVQVRIKMSGTNLQAEAVVQTESQPVAANTSPSLIMLEGTIIDPEGKPASYDIFVLGETGTTITTSSGQDGKFEYSNLPVGEYLFSCNPPNQFEPRLSIKTVEILKDKKTILNLNLKCHYSFSGRVTYEDGSPVVGLEMMAECEDKQIRFSNSVKTDEQGRYTLSMPLKTSITAGLRIMPDGYTTREGLYEDFIVGRDDINFVLIKASESSGNSSNYGAFFRSMTN